MSKSGNLAALSTLLNCTDAPTVYYAEDPPYLPRILFFYWPVQAVGSLGSTSRIRTTILSAAGFRSFGAFSVAPSSGYYSAVHKLPDDKQRDEVARGIAFALCRYFSEVPQAIKNAITDENLKEGIGLKWGQTHAAQITCGMSRVLNVDEIIEALRPFAKERPGVLPTPTGTPNSIRKTRPSVLPPDQPSQTPTTRHQPQSSPSSKRIPSGSTRRTPSAAHSPTLKRNAPGPAAARHPVQQLESLRFKMCEFVDTEDHYLSRLQELIDLVVSQGRTPKSLSSKFTNVSKQKTVNAMVQFPSLLDRIRDLNLAFLDSIESVLQSTEDGALSFLHTASPEGTISLAALKGKDPLGVLAFAKVLLQHFPNLTVPYREYLDLHSLISSNLEQYLKEGTASIQKAPSLLMEPAQRISRYGLYIDSMLPLIPSTSTTAIRTLEKARKIIAEICEMEPAASAILDSLRIEHEARRRAYSPTKLLSTLTRSHGSVREAPALTGASAKEHDAPRLFHSLGRSLSRRNARSRPGLQGILAEQDPDQACNSSPKSVSVRAPSAPSRSDENRPVTSSSSLSVGSVSRRPLTSSTNKSTTSEKLQLGAIPVLPPSSSHEPSKAVDLLAVGNESIEHYRAALMRVEEENYKLLQENAELKKRVRECCCGRALK
ncbi:hypothetical protein DV737_g4585, partial [Chaetothyriales sp. CBS 132003]